MRISERVWTLISVTAVAMLIWLWAAGATRAQQSISAQLLFMPGDASVRWIVTPAKQPVRIQIEGSRWSLQKASELLKTPLAIDLLPEVGSQAMDFMVQLNQSLRETGVRVIACEPSSLEVSVDRRERTTVPIRVNLAGIQTVGEVEVEPSEAVVTMPSLVRKRLSDQLAVEAVLAPAQLRDLAPGVKHTMAASLRLPESQGGVDAVIDPASAKVTFTIRSRTEETLLDSVRVQVAGPHQDFDEYSISLDDTLRNVTVTGDADLIRSIASGETRVVGLVHLTTNDKERGIQSKRISGFMAIGREGSVTMVNGRVGSSTELPLIQLQITKRSEMEPSPSGPAPTPAVGSPSGAMKPAP